jgi:DNA (cytosine-5)-methyltransferase 1
VSKSKPWITVRDAISDLPPPKGVEIRDAEHPPLDLHFGRTPTATSMARYKAIPKEGMNRFDLQRKAPHLTPDCWINKPSGSTDIFGRLWWDRPAVTMRTEFFKPEKGRYLHPQQHRPITHREAARFQSFPDDFAFCGTKIEIAKQIGNAVPPLLAAAVANCVFEIFSAKVADARCIQIEKAKRDHVSHQREKHKAGTAGKVVNSPARIPVSGPRK